MDHPSTSTIKVLLCLRLTALSNASEDTSDYIDLELIQHINVDCVRLNKLLNECVQKFRTLKNKVLLVLAQSLEKVHVKLMSVVLNPTRC